MNFTSAEYAAYLARSKSSRDHLFTGDGVDRESKLHDQIFVECSRRGWIALHGSTAHRAMRTIGEPDFTILADNGRVFFIECKTATGKLSTEQQGMIAWAAKLGHTVHVVRSFEQFLEVVK